MAVAKTTCNMCSRRCGLDVWVEEGKVTRVTPMKEHPFHQICVKAKAIPELVHSPERLTKPLKKVRGKFQEVTWDEALDFVARKLASIKQEYGARALVVHLGNAFVRSHIRELTRRFSDCYGTPNYTTGASVCHFARVAGERLTCGAYFTPHLSETNCVAVWGYNPPESDPFIYKEILDAVKRGAKLIVVDPLATRLARKAHLHAQLRPGTDGALALGILNIIIQEGLYDRDFVRDWTAGFESLAKLVKDYPPEKVSEITQVSTQTIHKMAHLYASTKPAAIAMGISQDHATNGLNAIRAITTLAAVTGNLEVPGGNVFTPPFRWKSLRLPHLVADSPSPYPLFARFAGEETVVPLIDQMATQKPYPLKALLAMGCNPAVTWPNSNKLADIRKNLELLVVSDIFLTETARLADVVLPGTTFLEREELRPYEARGTSLVALANQAIPPIGDCRDETGVILELGRRMGYGEHFPWKDTGELLGYMIAGTGITLDGLRQNPGGLYYAEREFQKYLKNGFNTPSKKVELYSQLMAEHGYDPLPLYREPSESPLSRPDLAKTYPLVLTSGARTIAYLHSEYRNLPGLRRLVPEPRLEIHPQTAESLDISEGDRVRLESPRGGIQVKAHLSRDILPEVVSIQHGWSEANINLLTDDVARDPVSAFPGYRSLLCRVRKV